MTVHSSNRHLVVLAFSMRGYISYMNRNSGQVSSEAAATLGYRRVVLVGASRTNSGTCGCSRVSGLCPQGSCYTGRNGSSMVTHSAGASRRGPIPAQRNDKLQIVLPLCLLLFLPHLSASPLPFSHTPTPSPLRTTIKHSLLQ